MARIILIISLTLGALKLMAQAQVTPGSQNLEPGQVSMSNWVDRTALFPGDSLTYHIKIRVDANMGILLDDLNGDELILSGLELDSSDVVEAVTDDGTTYHASYHLSTFETGTAILGIDGLTVRYYFRRPGQRLENVAAAGELQVPAVSLALQSTLPGDPASLGLRDMGNISVFQGLMRGAGILGFILFLLSVIPLIFLIRGQLNKKQLEEVSHDREEIIKETSAEILELENLDPDIPEQRREGFNQLEHIIKEYIQGAAGIKTTSLTSTELPDKVTDLDPSLPVSDLAVILGYCETARYGKPEDLPSSDSFNKGLMAVQGLFRA